MNDKGFDYINVIPLVDIMLVLLAIVLTTATFIAHGDIPVTLPKAEAPSEVRELKGVVITVSKEGKIFFHKREVSLKQLREELEKLPKETPVSVWADKDAKVERFVKVMGLLSSMGFGNASVVVEKE